MLLPPLKKKTRKTYFQHYSHHQKDKEERRWKDKFHELEKRYDILLENSAYFFIWEFFIIVVFILFL
jgi:transcriptional regulatory protein LevR